MIDLASAVTASLNDTFGRPVQIRRRVPLGGGSINLTERVETTAGDFVLKSNRGAPAGFFQAEADGLTALRDSGATLVIPRAIACRDTAPSFLVLEYLEAGRRRPDFDESLGRGLAELHRATSARFGFARDNFCGATAQPNAWTDRWVDFYGGRRLGHQLRMAVDAGRLSTSERGAIDRLIAHLDEWISEPEYGPSLIHGDLWSGNLHRDGTGHPALIDPAAYYAHREAELGMMTLFGGFSEQVFAAYHEAFTVDDGWRDRNPLYQLYHLLNHLNLFGQGYHEQVMTVVRRYA